MFQASPKWRGNDLTTPAFGLQLGDEGQNRLGHRRRGRNEFEPRLVHDLPLLDVTEEILEENSIRKQGSDRLMKIWDEGN